MRERAGVQHVIPRVLRVGLAEVRSANELRCMRIPGVLRVGLAKRRFANWPPRMRADARSAPRRISGALAERYSAKA